jgi:hypothetical protein
MSEKKQNERLVEVKRGLASKYERLARICNSRNRRKTLLRHCRSYREQAEQIAERLK